MRARCAIYAPASAYVPLNVRDGANVTPDEEGGPPWAEVLQKEFGTLRHGTSVYDARLLQTLRVTAAADSVLLVFDDHAGRRMEYASMRTSSGMQRILRSAR